MELAEVGGGAAAAVLSTALAIAVVALAAPAATVAAAGVVLAAAVGGSGPAGAGASVPGGRLPLLGAESSTGMVSLTVWGCEAFRGGDALAVVPVEPVGAEPVGATAAVVVGAEA